MVRVLLLILLVFYAHVSTACFILFYSDGKTVLVGNHEDWFTKDGAVRINPPSQGRYGSVTFTFLSEGWAQGGMNEKGLFFDAAQTPDSDLVFNDGLRTPTGYIWQTVLDKAATVDEALALLKDYKLPELQNATILLADATGKAVIIGGHDHKVDVMKPSGQFLLQTNFNQWHPELSDEPVCNRFQAAQNHLSRSSEVSVENIRSILEKTHQDSLTIYSNIYDLRNKTVYTYNKRHFGKPMVIKLPDFFRYGECLVSLDSLEADPTAWNHCKEFPKTISIRGKVVDDKTRSPIPYANIGLLDQNVGTLSDPDGSFEIALPFSSLGDSLIFSSVGYNRSKVRVTPKSAGEMSIKLKAETVMLKEVTIKGKKLSSKVARLGWMGGRDGVLPLDTIQGGGAVALLVESPALLSYVEKLQVRLMYNSKDTLQLRFHIYEYDSLHDRPGNELLAKEIILKDSKRFGWLRFDLMEYGIFVNKKKFFIGFEWIDDRMTRTRMVKGLRAWEAWKKEEFEKGNQKVEYRAPTSPGERGSYKYNGNMMNWPGWSTLPPFTGLMIETGKHSKTQSLRTFERKTSFGLWKEIPSTLNAVVTVVF